MIPSPAHSSNSLLSTAATSPHGASSTSGGSNISYYHHAGGSVGQLSPSCQSVSSVSSMESASPRAPPPGNRFSSLPLPAISGVHLPPPSIITTNSSGSILQGEILNCYMESFVLLIKYFSRCRLESNDSYAKRSTRLWIHYSLGTRLS